ncbi:hypothetical protein ACX0G9_15600 [Flavitalea flava]
MKASASMRLWFAIMGAILWAGIYFTGFSKVNWLVYLPAAGLVFAGISGVCPSQMLLFKIFPGKNKKDFK